MSLTLSNGCSGWPEIFRRYSRYEYKRAKYQDLVSDILSPMDGPYIVSPLKLDGVVTQLTVCIPSFPG